MANVVKEAQTAANRSRRIAMDAAHKSRNAKLAPHRHALRCKGALARIDRRILAAAESARARLTEIRVKVSAAHVAAVKAA